MVDYCDDGGVVKCGPRTVVLVVVTWVNSENGWIIGCCDTILSRLVFCCYVTDMRKGVQRVATPVLERNITRTAIST